MNEYFFIYYLELANPPGPSSECFQLQKHGWLSIGCAQFSEDESKPNTFQSRGDAEAALIEIQKALNFL